jgi:hypothetical protein
MTAEVVGVPAGTVRVRLRRLRNSSSTRLAGRHDADGKGMNPPEPLNVFGLTDPFDNDLLSEQDEALLLRILETPVVVKRSRHWWKQP